MVGGRSPAPADRRGDQWPADAPYRGGDAVPKSPRLDGGTAHGQDRLLRFEDLVWGSASASKPWRSTPTT